MSARPKVSLIMPAFIRDAVNLAYFAEALASARAQTYDNLEILIVNDGSPFTGPLEELVAAQGSAVRYVKKANGGVASALNVALKEMTGEYFTWLSHDDLYLPEKVSAQMNHLAKLPPETIAYCDVEHIDSHGGHQFFESSPDVPAGTCRVFFAQYGGFNANAHLIPRRCFDRVGGFDESLRTTQDNHMWYRLSEHFEFRRVPQVLMKYRNHPTQDSRSPIHVKECNELYTYFLEALDRNAIVRSATVSPARFYAECACVRRNRGYVDAERYATRRALRELLLHPQKERPHFNLIVGLWLTRLRAGRGLLMPAKPVSP